MLWKILSGLSVFALIAGAIFAYFDWPIVKEEQVLRVRSENNLKEIKQLQVVAAEAKTKKARELDELTKQRDEVKDKVAKTNWLALMRKRRKMTR